ncbi:MAG: hypothetical protein IJD89_07785 [Clostridia bacterium]|nr:hypothetical protein [Clostridia bacterium]
MIFYARSVFMYSFIDLHNHFIYSIDDGAKNQAMMEKMLDIAYEDGIKTICFTPHFKIYRFNDEEEIKEYNAHILRRFNKATKYVAEKHPDMQLLLGNEIMYHNDICNSLLNKNCKMLNNGKYVLIEFSPHISEFDLTNATQKLLRKGYKPVLAHFERYDCIIKKPSLLNELKSSGVTIQSNASTITKFGLGKTARIVKWALKKHLIDLVATDAHDDKIFAPILSKAHKKVQKKYGDEYAKKIFHDTPALIIKS